MKVFMERQKNIKKFESLTKKNKALANEIALKEFEKPVNKRMLPGTILEIVEFKL